MKHFLSALLPRDYREQVLGDLQERGFRLRDIASVLPRIWWSHLRRSSGVPILTGASEITLRNRAQQFQRRRAYALVTGALVNATVFLALSGMFSDFSDITWSAQTGAALAILAVCLMFFFIGAMAIRKLATLTAPPLPSGREEWLEHHRNQLKAAFQQSRFGGPLFPMQVWVVVNLLMSSRMRPEIQSNLRLTSIVAALLIVFAFARFRAARLRKELEALQ